MGIKELSLFLIVIISWGTWGMLEKQILTLTNVGTYLFVFSIIQAIVNIPFYYLVMKWNKDVLDLSKNVIIQTTIVTVILAVSYVAYALLLKSGNASKVVPITSAYPLITVVLSVIFLNEIVKTNMIIGSIFIVIGLMVIY